MMRTICWACTALIFAFKAFANSDEVSDGLSHMIEKVYHPSNSLIFIFQAETFRRLIFGRILWLHLMSIRTFRTDGKLHSSSCFLSVKIAYEAGGISVQMQS